MVVLVAVFGASCACCYFGISVTTMVRDLHLSSIVIVVSMPSANVGASLVQFVLWDGDFVNLRNGRVRTRDSVV